MSGRSPEPENETLTISRSLLESLVDEGECSFDHHGNCQAHMYFALEGEPCPMKEAQEILAKSWKLG